MITEEMRQVWYGSDLSFDAVEADKKIQRIIELHEQTKPRPEPVGFRVEFYTNSKIFLTALLDYVEIVKVMKDNPFFNVHEVAYHVLENEDKGLFIEPLYTTPPTREPLSQSDLGIFIGEFLMIEKPLKNLSHFARIIEKAHGIGV